MQWQMKPATELSSVMLVTRLGNDTHEEEREIEVGQWCPSKKELYRVVDELNLKDNFPDEALSRCPDAEPEYSSMDRREKRAVQPSTTLWDELRNLQYYIRARKIIV